MLRNAESAIDSMIKNASAIASASFGEIEFDIEEVHEEESPVSPEPAPAKDVKTVSSAPDNMVKVDIGNGVVANMKVSDLEKVNQI